jgi:hypothetical protein
VYEIVPAVTAVRYLFNPNARQAENEKREVEFAARVFGLRLGGYRQHE